MFLRVDENGRATRIPKGSRVALAVGGDAVIRWQDSDAEEPSEVVEWQVEAGDVFDAIVVDAEVWLFVAVPSGGAPNVRVPVFLSIVEPS